MMELIMGCNFTLNALSGNKVTADADYNHDVFQVSCL